MSIAFRPLDRSDFPMLSTWLAAPHVATWWREDHDLIRIEAKYGPCVAGDEPTEVFVIESDGKPIGLIQRYRIDDYPDWERAVAVGSVPENAVGIDYLIGIETLLGRGLGPLIIDQFVREAWSRYPDAACRRRRRTPSQQALVACAREGWFRAEVGRDDPFRRSERRRPRLSVRAPAAKL